MDSKENGEGRERRKVESVVGHVSVLCRCVFAFWWEKSKFPVGYVMPREEEVKVWTVTGEEGVKG